MKKEETLYYINSQRTNIWIKNIQKDNTLKIQFNQEKTLIWKNA